VIAIVGTGVQSRYAVRVAMAQWSLSRRKVRPPRRGSYAVGLWVTALMAVAASVRFWLVACAAPILHRARADVGRRHRSPKRVARCVLSERPRPSTDAAERDGNSPQSPNADLIDTVAVEVHYGAVDV
jgi:hypothetical protein